MKRHEYWMAMLISFVIWFIGMFVIAGFVCDLPWMQNWMGGTPMAVETALCFVLTGVTLYLLSMRRV